MNAASPLVVAGRGSGLEPGQIGDVMAAQTDPSKERVMLHWALVFLVVALIAAVFGFGGIASTAAGMAQILFVIALVLFVVSLLAGFLRRSP